MHARISPTPLFHTHTHMSVLTYTRSHACKRTHKLAHTRPCPHISTQIPKLHLLQKQGGVLERRQANAGVALERGL